MKKSKSLLKMLLVGSCLLSITACGQASVTGGKNTEGNTTPIVKDAYTFTYNLNYEGSTAKTVNVKANTRATNWKATRSGYTLDGWYNEKECKNKFDFAQYINADTNVYALWVKNAEKFEVSLSYNYEGADGDAKIMIEENKKISASDIPTCPRLGMVYDGWYTDQACNTPWNFDSDVVKGKMTLYAKYSLDPSIKRDADGNILFENVVVGAWLSSDFGNRNTMKQLVSSFNALPENTGKIRIVASDTLASQDDYSLRFQQTPGFNNTYTAYYKASDVYALAGLDYNKSDYLENACKENYIDGVAYSTPIYAGIPYLIYNKDLMTKYNGTNPMPTNFTEYKTLLKAAYDGEKTTNTNFKSIVTSRSWTFKECASMAPFFQNNADYYVREGDSLVNKWDTGSAEYNNAKTTLENIYDLFGPSGECGGAASGPENEYTDNTAISSVGDGNALMGLINFPASTTSWISNTKIGALPLSGLFADSDKTQMNQIPIHQVGFEFYKAKNVSLTQLAAAAKFVDYVSKNSYKFAENGWYPLRKSVIESDQFKNTTNAKAKFIQTIAKPENLTTLYGSSTQKNIFNQTVAEGYIIPLFDATSKEEAVAILDSLRDAISSQL